MSKLKQTKVLTLAALLAAIAIVLGFFKIPITPALEIRFVSIPLTIAGALLGPWIGAIVGVIADIGGYLARPTGPFFPLFSLSNACVAIIGAYFLYRKRPTIKRIILSQCAIGLIVGLLMNSLWLSILLKIPFLTLLISRAPKEIFQFSVNALIIYLILQKLPIHSLLDLKKEDLE